MDSVISPAIRVLLEEKIVQSGSYSPKLFNQESHPSLSEILKIFPAYKLLTMMQEAAKPLTEMKMSPPFREKPETEKGSLLQDLLQNPEKGLSLLTSISILSYLNKQPEQFQQLMQQISEQFSEKIAPPAVWEFIAILRRDLQYLQTLLATTPFEEVQKALEKVLQNLEHLPEVLKKDSEIGEPSTHEFSQMQTKEQAMSPMLLKRETEMESLETELFEKMSESNTSSSVAHTLNTQPTLKESNQLPLAFVVPYNAAARLEMRPEKAKRKKHEEEEILEEEEEREEESL